MTIQTLKTTHNAPGICLFGGMPDTRNLGVSALCFSVIAGILQRIEGARLTVFGLNGDIRERTYCTEDQTFHYTQIGALYSRRYYRRNNLWNMRVSGWLGGLGNPGVQEIRDARAVLDLSQGDSFTDLYGLKRFRSVTLPKLVTLQQNRPLLLLPQTYGPFENPGCRRIAERIVRGATAAWARDERSFKTLRELLGDAYDPKRHHSGVDVAFALPVTKPGKPLPERISDWLSEYRTEPVIGLNVSGLIYNNPDTAVSRYGFRADYRKVIIDFIRLLLQQTKVNILLIPHVLTPDGHYESDPSANNDIAEKLAGISGNRILMIPPVYTPSEMKWVISRCDWFCGTRMHSTIAGLSTGAPTAAIAYSLKTQGVFETCGQGGHVVDPRSLLTEDVVNRLYRSFQEYLKTRHDLALHLPLIKQRAAMQMDQIASACLDT